jgi:hypothetical protein
MIIISWKKRRVIAEEKPAADWFYWFLSNMKIFASLMWKLELTGKLQLCFSLHVL